MDHDVASYEPFFGFVERPFSLTPDPRYYYRSRSHSHAFDALTAGLARRERMLLIGGDLGVGKTTLCRTLIDVLSRRTRVAMVGNPLASPDDLLRLLLQDFVVVPKEERRGGLPDMPSTELRARFDAFVAGLRTSRDTAVLIVDEAQNLPLATAALVADLSDGDASSDPGLQVVLAGQAPATGAPALARPIEERLATRVRLMPIDRDECQRYLEHRLTIAGAGMKVTFTARALEVMFGLSGGLPRLINLIAERALREAAAAASYRIEASMVESAASALEILRIKPRRFRWFGSSDGSVRGTL